MQSGSLLHGLEQRAQGLGLWVGNWLRLALLGVFGKTAMTGAHVLPWSVSLATSPGVQRMCPSGAFCKAFIIRTLFATGAGGWVSDVGLVGCVTSVLLCIIEQRGRSQASVSTVHLSKSIWQAAQRPVWQEFCISTHAPAVLFVLSVVPSPQVTCWLLLFCFEACSSVQRELFQAAGVFGCVHAVRMLQD